MLCTSSVGTSGFTESEMKCVIAGIAGTQGLFPSFVGMYDNLGSLVAITHSICVCRHAGFILCRVLPSTVYKCVE
jgi:hypothetical protein